MTIQAKWDAFWRVFWVNKGYEKVLEEGLSNTLYIAVLGLLIGTVIGTLIASVKVMPKYKTLPKVMNSVCSVYVGFFRGTPIVVQLLLAYYVIFPLIGINLGSLNTCVLIFGLNSGAYVSEIMRGGINSIDAGQLEAGRAVGLPYSIAMLKIVIPQAIKNILPTLGNEFIVLIKETSVVSFVAVTDLYKSFKQLGDPKYNYIVPYLMLALTYLVLVLIISAGVRALEKHLNKSVK